MCMVGFDDLRAQGQGLVTQGRQSQDQGQGQGQLPRTVELYTMCPRRTSSPRTLSPMTPITINYDTVSML